jgi:hypothetical protein
MISLPPSGSYLRLRLGSARWNGPLDRTGPPITCSFSEHRALQVSMSGLSQGCHICFLPSSHLSISWR